MDTVNIVIYARYSSHAQNEQSIERQLHACYDFARRNEYVVNISDDASGILMEAVLEGSNSKNGQSVKI